MAKIIVTIPDNYPRVEGIIEIFGKDPLTGRQLHYQYYPLDQNLEPKLVIRVGFAESD